MNRLKEETTALWKDEKHMHVLDNDLNMVIRRLIITMKEDRIALHWAELEELGINMHEELFDFLDGHITDSYTNERTGENVCIYELPTIKFATDQHGTIHDYNNFEELKKDIYEI